MSKLKKISLIAFITIILGMAVSLVSYASTKWETDPSNFNIDKVNVGDTITMSREYVQNYAKKHNNLEDFMCIYAHQSYEGKKPYKAVSVVDIIGNTATNNKGKKVEHDIHNGTLAYLLSLDQHKGSFYHPINNDDPVQFLIWYYMDIWVQSVGKQFGLNGIASKQEERGTDSMIKYIREKVDEAKNYAEKLEKEELKNKTKKEDVTVKTQELNGKEYIRIGKIKYAFQSKLSEIEVTDDKGKKIDGIIFGKYEGKTLKEVKIGNIKSNDEFYIMIPSDKISTERVYIKVINEFKVKTAKVVFWENQRNKNSSAKCQNIIQFKTGETTQHLEDNFDNGGKGFPVIGKLKITKKDYDNQETTIADVTLKIRNEEGKYVKQDANGEISYVDEANATIFKTDENGEIKVEKLLVGKYIITEITNPSKAYGGESGTVEDVYYNTTADGDIIEVKTEGGNASTEDESQETAQQTLPEITVNVEANSESYTTLNIYNKKKYIDISGYVWEDTAEEKDNVRENHEKDIYAPSDEEHERDILLEGITVLLKKQNGETSETVAETTTDENGHYKFENLLIEELANYYVEFVYDGLTYTTVAPLAETDVKTYNENYGTQIESSTEVNSKASEVVKERKELNSNFEEITNHGSLDESERELGYSRKTRAENKEGETAGEATGTITYKLETATDEEGQTTYSSATFESYDGDIDITANTNIEGYSINDSYKNNNYITNKDGSIEIPYINMGLYRREKPNISVRDDLTRVHLQVNGIGMTYDDTTDDYGDYTEEVRAGNLDVKFGTEYGPYYRSVYPSDIKFSSTLKEEDDAKKLKIYAVYTVTVTNNSNSLTMGVPEIVNYYDSGYDIIGNNIDFPRENTILDGVRIVAVNIDALEEDDTATNDERVIDEDKINVAQEEVNGFKCARINLIDDETGIPQLDYGKSLKLEITYKVSDETVIGLLNSDKVMKNVSEVSAYSTYYSKSIEGCEPGEFYAGIDKNSAPENAIPSNGDGEEEDLSTYEDDTDSAPRFILTAKGVRQIEGTVFEDESKFEGENPNPEAIHSGEDRLGNGYLDENENKVSGVSVELLRAEDLTNATYYPYDVITEEGENQGRITNIADLDPTDEALRTEEDGYYIFRGVEPDKYYIRFTYTNGVTKICDLDGNEVDVTVQNYKSTIITSDTIKNAFKNGDDLWYQSQKEETYSTAIDDLQTRNDIDKELKVISAQSKKAIEEKTANSDNASLFADTPQFEIPVEIDNETDADDNLFIKKISNINFGIIERPRQEVALDKRVNHIKLTTQDGKVLVDVNPLETDDLGEYIQDLGENGYYIQCSDRELMGGAHLELGYKFTVYNNSELDFVNEDGTVNDLYYYYGDKATGIPVSITSAKIIDFVDPEVVLTEGQVGGEEKTWNIIESITDGGLNWNLEQPDLDKLLEDFGVVVMAEPIPENDFITPEDGKNSKSVDISVEKLLSNSSEDEAWVYENYGEVVQIVKGGGGDTTTDVGNFAELLTSEGDPEEVEKTIEEYEFEVDEYKAETVTLGDPFGSTDYTVTYAIIGAVSMVILGAGIFGIKKVLKQ